MAKGEKKEKGGGKDQPKIVIDPEICKSEVEVVKYYITIDDLQWQLQAKAEYCNKLIESSNRYLEMEQDSTRTKLETIDRYKDLIRDKAQEMGDLQHQITDMMEVLDMAERERSANREKQQKEYEEQTTKLQKEIDFFKEEIASLEEYKDCEKDLENSLEEVKKLVEEQEENYRKSLEKLKAKSIRDYEMLSKYIYNQIYESSKKLGEDMKGHLLGGMERALNENYALQKEIATLESMSASYQKDLVEWAKEEEKLNAELQTRKAEEMKMARKYINQDTVIDLLVKKLKEQSVQIQHNLQWKMKLGTLQTTNNQIKEDLETIKKHLEDLKAVKEAIESDISRLTEDLDYQIKIGKVLHSALEKCANIIGRGVFDVRDPDEDEETFAERTYNILQTLIAQVTDTFQELEGSETGEIILEYQSALDQVDALGARPKELIDRAVQATRYRYQRHPLAPQVSVVESSVQCDLYEPPKAGSQVKRPIKHARITHDLVSKAEGKILSDFGMFTMYCDSRKKVDTL